MTPFVLSSKITALKATPSGRYDNLHQYMEVWDGLVYIM